MFKETKTKQGTVLFNLKHVTHITDVGNGYKEIHFLDGKSIVAKYSIETLHEIFL